MALHFLTTDDTWESQVKAWSRRTPRTFTDGQGEMFEPERVMWKPDDFLSVELVPSKVKQVLSGFIFRLLDWNQICR